MNENKRKGDCILIEVIALILIFVLLSFILHQHLINEQRYKLMYQMVVASSEFEKKVDASSQLNDAILRMMVINGSIHCNTRSINLEQNKKRIAASDNLNAVAKEVNTNELFGYIVNKSIQQLIYFDKNVEDLCGKNSPSPQDWVIKFQYVIDLLNQAMNIESDKLKALEKQKTAAYKKF